MSLLHEMRTRGIPHRNSVLLNDSLEEKVNQAKRSESKFISDEVAFDMNLLLWTTMAYHAPPLNAVCIDATLRNKSTPNNNQNAFHPERYIRAIKELYENGMNWRFVLHLPAVARKPELREYNPVFAAFGSEIYCIIDLGSERKFNIALPIRDLTSIRCEQVDDSDYSTIIGNKTVSEETLIKPKTALEHYVRFRGFKPIATGDVLGDDLKKIANNVLVPQFPNQNLLRCNYSHDRLTMKGFVLYTEKSTPTLYELNFKGVYKQSGSDTDKAGHMREYWAARIVSERRDSNIKRYTGMEAIKRLHKARPIRGSCF